MKSGLMRHNSFKIVLSDKQAYYLIKMHWCICRISHFQTICPDIVSNFVTLWAYDQTYFCKNVMLHCNSIILSYFFWMNKLEYHLVTTYEQISIHYTSVCIWNNQSYFIATYDSLVLDTSTLFKYNKIFPLS